MLEDVPKKCRLPIHRASPSSIPFPLPLPFQKATNAITGGFLKRQGKGKGDAGGGGAVNRKPTFLGHIFDLDHECNNRVFMEVVQ
jgi:hypothetical protein